MLPAPNIDRTAHAPIWRLCESLLVTTEELAKHWRLSPDYLANVRRHGRGIPYVKLPTGRVLYRLSDVLAAEAAGERGEITMPRIELALATMKGLPVETRIAVTEHLKRFFDPAGKLP